MPLPYVAYELFHLSPTLCFLCDYNVGPINGIVLV